MNEADASAWVTANYGLLVKIARDILLNEDDARDTAQDAAIRLLQKWDQFEDRGEGKRQAWCFTVAKRVALDALRRRKRRQLRETRLPGGYRADRRTVRLRVRRALARATTHGKA